MKVGQLIEYLQGFHGEVEIAYKDGNFGGESDPFTTFDIEFDPGSGKILINSPYWTPVD